MVLAAVHTEPVNEAGAHPGDERGRPGAGPGAQPPRGAAARGGSLKVVTTGMKAGYLRKNGVPYSADAVMTEYIDRFDLPNGDALLVVSTELVDPTYLTTPFFTVFAERFGKSVAK